MSDQPDKQPPDQPASPSTRRSARPSQLAGPDTSAGRPHPDQEQDIWSGRTCWKHSSPALLAWAAFSVAVVLVGLWLRAQAASTPGPWAGWLMVALIVLPGLYVACKALARVYGVHYRLTTQRLFVRRGLLARTTDQTELIRVDDVRVHKSLTDRLFGIGAVEILSTDATDAALRLEGIEAPDQIAEHIRKHMRILRQSSLYMENL